MIFSDDFSVECNISQFLAAYARPVFAMASKTWLKQAPANRGLELRCQ